MLLDIKERRARQLLQELQGQKKVEVYGANRVRRYRLVKKDARKKVTEKSDRKKVTEKTEKQMELILSQMQPNVEYKVEEAAGWLNVGRTRARTLLKIMVADGKILETGITKMKRYRKSKKHDNYDKNS